LHIVVVLRLVPDITEELDLADDGRDIDREWAGIRMNDFDDQALEQAVLLKEIHGAKVTAVALEAEGVERMLHTAIARGVDQAVKITHGAEEVILSIAAAPLVAAAVRDLNADLVLTGVQPPEDWFGQLAPLVAAELDWPCISGVNGIAVHDSAIEVQQEHSGGVSATLDVQLPAVLGVQSAAQPPRYASGTKLREAIAGDALRSAAVDGPPGQAKAHLVALEQRTSDGGAQMLEGSPENIAERGLRFRLRRFSFPTFWNIGV